MVQAFTPLVTFDEFVAWYPENSEIHYELRRGAILEMPKPRGKHSEVAGYIALKLRIEIEKLTLPYFLPRECIVRSIDGTSGYEPDAIVLDRTTIGADPRWERESIITLATSIKLVVEVVSTNWRDDYLMKFAEYESLGIPEYWIADYAGLGGRRYLGEVKQPTLTICSLVDGEYEMQQFSGDRSIISPTFPGLNLTAAEILEVEQRH
jgi:Uma2 family endonuclease